MIIKLCENSSNAHHSYSVYNELISASDNYMMYKITKNPASPLGDVLHHRMVYLERGKITPQEIIINPKTELIEKITFFVKQNSEYEIDLNTYNIISKSGEPKIVFDECTNDWKGRFYKIIKDCILLWGKKDNRLFFILSDSQHTLFSIKITNTVSLLLDDKNDIKGISIILLN